MSIEIIKTDITDMEVDAIVNAANTSLLRGGGVCGAIFKKAGFDLDKECQEIGHCNTGEAVITKGYDLKAKYIIEELSLEETLSYLTFIIRGERFCDGHIASFLKDGTIERLGNNL